MIAYDGPPAEWLATGGRPASCLGTDMPAYESDDGVAVMEFLTVLLHRDGSADAMPRGYGAATILAEDGLAPAWAFPRSEGREEPLVGEYAYRPKLHTWRLLSWGDTIFRGGWWQARGSQSELSYRYGIRKAMLEGRPDALEGPSEKAALLLAEQLDPQQSIEYRAAGTFRVRGARTGNVYRVNIGDGFELLDETNDRALVSYCLHPDYWIPDEDVALATKLALEDPELEIEVLEGGATMTMRERERSATIADRIASELEKRYRLVDAPRPIAMPKGVECPSTT